MITNERGNFLNEEHKKIKAIVMQNLMDVLNERKINIGEKSTMLEMFFDVIREEVLPKIGTMQ
jgi:hypothetical protein